MNIRPTRFRKKPVEIVAMRVINPVDSIETVLRWIRREGGTAYLHLNCGDGESHLLIRTLEGDMIAALGDYVIRGVQGEFYPCKPDIFEATYELAEGGEAA
ncbi:MULTISPECIES: hypothetical protein [Brachybacterium]|uniref:Phage protein n=2 Tax=Brachybacterium TaxID=43668 RepID=A0A3R8RP54_9MICO|nr:MULTISPECIES: hypothetical protein [Brachybacterium]RRR18278.1 hypothetical protein DS079_11065 [Brachybacterium paraconglomeratum]GLI30388.1 hypothetical protein BCONGLO52_12290 [Brachybacterium conglomeratum]GLK04927.1 hypothetical protein GCM10017597_17270 [Brachybacterium conglomeratum]